MYICLCKGITDSQIKQAVNQGACSLNQVRRELGVMSQCGKCGVIAREVVNQALADRSTTHPQSPYYEVS